MVTIAQTIKGHSLALPHEGLSEKAHFIDMIH